MVIEVTIWVQIPHWPEFFSYIHSHWLRHFCLHQNTMLQIELLCCSGIMYWWGVNCISWPHPFFCTCGRCHWWCGITVNVLNSCWKGLGFIPGSVILCSWTKHFSFTVPLSTQGSLRKYWGVTQRWTSIPSRGSCNTLCCFMLWKPR